MSRILLSTALLALLAACSAERTQTGEEAAPNPAPAPIDDQPVEDVPPATAPVAPEAPSAEPGATADGDQARFDGYGDVKFGIAADAMEAAWGGELNTLGKDNNPSCYFMTPKWVKAPADFAFLIGDGKFARFGTEDAKLVAPGGGKIGMSKAEIGKLYAGAVEAQPHKYTDGEYLRIKDPAGGAGMLVFETDGKGDTAKVTEWRVGVPPQVDFVEGCS